MATHSGSTCVREGLWLSDRCATFNAMNTSPGQSQTHADCVDKTLFRVVAALAALLGFGIISLLIVIFTTSHGSTAEAADSSGSAVSVATACRDNRGYLSLAPDKKSIDFKNRYGSADAEVVFQCILKRTKAPSSIESRIGNTRGLDGSQSASWTGWSIYWSYMKGEGLNVTLAEE